jgi:hypothetical protein
MPGATVHGMQPLGLVLVPEPPAAGRVVSAAQAILPNVGPVRSVLGVGALPHVSLAHVRSTLDASQIWAEVERRFPSEQMVMTPAGIRFHGYDKAYLADESGGGLTVFLQVLFDDAMRDLRTLTTETTWFTTGEATYNGVEVTMDPHFTLGSTMPGSGYRVAGPIDIPVDLLNAGMPARLALGPIGAFGVLEDVFFGGW